MLSAAALATLMVSSLFVGILICIAQLRLALRIIRAKTDVPIFNQLFVLCLGVSGLSSINSYRCCWISGWCNALKNPFIGIRTISSILANRTSGNFKGTLRHWVIVIVVVIMIIRSGHRDISAPEHVDPLSWGQLHFPGAQTETLFCSRCGENHHNFCSS